MSHNEPAHIQYPFAEPGSFAGYDLAHDAILITQDPRPALAFYRDALIAFLPTDRRWVARREWAQGEMHEFYNRLGIYKRNQVPDEEFWKLYHDEMTHPGVMLHIAAQQARESLDGL